MTTERKDQKPAAGPSVEAPAKAVPPRRAMGWSPRESGCPVCYWQARHTFVEAVVDAFGQGDALAEIGNAKALQQRGGQLADAAKGIRDLVMLGYYQRPESWPALGYPLPPVPPKPRPMRAAYAALLAPAGVAPGEWPARKP